MPPKSGILVAIRKVCLNNFKITVQLQHSLRLVVRYKQILQANAKSENLQGLPARGETCRGLTLWFLKTRRVCSFCKEPAFHTRRLTERILSKLEFLFKFYAEKCQLIHLSWQRRTDAQILELILDLRHMACS